MPRQGVAFDVDARLVEMTRRLADAGDDALWA